MQGETNKRPSNSRRSFLKWSSAVASGLLLARSSRARGSVETLALNGGPKAVTEPHGDSMRWPRWGDTEEKAVINLLRNPGYAPLDALEREWKDYFKVPYCKTHMNGTSALTSMFFAMNLPPGSEVMVPSYTLWFTILPMRVFGLVPRFVDVNPRTLNFDLEDAKRRLTKRTKAVLPVHWCGVPSEMDHICEWADEKGLLVLEDVCPSHGAKLKGKYAGAWGHMGAFSFQYSKIIPGGEGGMGVYREREHYERATAVGHYEACPRFPEDSPYHQYGSSGLGLKLRIHPVGAVLASCQLKMMAKYQALATAQIRRLNERVLQLPGLYPRDCRPDMETSCRGDILLIDEAQAGMSQAACIKALQAEGVRAYARPIPLQHTLPVYHQAQWWHHKPEIPTSLPGSEQVNRTAIWMPYFSAKVPKLMDQYARAFEKVWAHRNELATA